jgi:DNA-binding SARP family transcriptional activator
LSTGDHPNGSANEHINVVSLQKSESINLSQSLSALSTASPPETAVTDLAMTAYLLGKFQVSINNQSLSKWPGSRSLGVFKYLLTYKDKEIPRDVLMEVFWPGTDPDSARNNLNVTFHKLRQVFSTVTTTPLIIFEHGNYHFNPEIHVWTDIEEFERHSQAARSLQVKGHLINAVAEYEIASNLYQGDFLSDEPYEDWAVNTRERLRVIFLDMLDRLSQIYFSQGSYTTSAALCQRILECDNCREDATCRLMRCYCRIGQHNLALRQYQAIVEALRTELDVAPESTTTELAERIRRHERV